MKSITTFSFLALFGVLKINAQSTQNSSGDNATGTTGNVSYSVGQIFYESSTSPGGNINTGVQNAYEITETLGQEISQIGLALKIYPNPTTDILNLKIDFTDHQKYSYELYDLAGKILNKKAVSGKVTELSISNYPSGTYLLKVSKNNKPVKIFKVLKTDK
ncbi:T9SS type A sorting domain-containing protein [Chryseobacterium sp. FH1]|uniref:T9SS type A sorting domain-containing protein n=1 Tax=Chryseobacterium sp. FH1 TaxID=1233951 RepID=UPI0004E36A03|nr:T9SS type A sorting domain-containing protein [Chryseobacterium sp. FH1]KFC19553.1 hypothetical protein IO90_09725 [Chryseobacterium sp. FH1]